MSTYRLADIDPEQPTYTYKGVGFYFRAQGQAADCGPKEASSRSLEKAATAQPQQQLQQQLQQQQKQSEGVHL